MLGDAGPAGGAVVRRGSLALIIASGAVRCEPVSRDRSTGKSARVRAGRAASGNWPSWTGDREERGSGWNSTGAQASAVLSQAKVRIRPC